MIPDIDVKGADLFRLAGFARFTAGAIVADTPQTEMPRERFVSRDPAEVGAQLAPGKKKRKRDYAVHKKDIVGLYLGGIEYRLNHKHDEPRHEQGERQIGRRCIRRAGDLHVRASALRLDGFGQASDGFG